MSEVHQLLPKMVVRPFQDYKEGVVTIVSDDRIDITREATLYLKKLHRQKEQDLLGAVVMRRVTRIKTGFKASERLMLTRGLAGIFHADRMIAQQGSIPPEWRQFHLLFPGTIWENKNWWSAGNTEGLTCLYWNHDEWFLELHCLARPFRNDQNWRVVCYRHTLPKKVKREVSSS